MINRMRLSVCYQLFQEFGKVTLIEYKDLGLRKYYFMLFVTNASDMSSEVKRSSSLTYLFRKAYFITSACVEATRWEKSRKTRIRIRWKRRTRMMKMRKK